MIVYARFDPARYFCWAPHDVSWTYEAEVFLDGRRLGREEMRERYRLRRPGFEEHSIEHLFRALAQYERTYGRGDDVRIRVVYRKNGGPAREWTWP